MLFSMVISVSPAAMLIVWSELFESWLVTTEEVVEVLSAAIIGCSGSIVGVGVVSSLMTV